MEDIYTLEQVAEKLHVQLRTVQKWVRAKKIRARKMGRVWRVEDSALQEYIKGLPENIPKGK